MRDQAPAAPAQEAGISVRALMDARMEQQRLLAKWIEPAEPPDVAPPRPSPPKPHSEARRQIDLA